MVFLEALASVGYKTYKAVILLSLPKVSLIPSFLS